MQEEITDDDYRALHEFRYALRRFLHFSEEAAKAAGLEPQQHQLMLAIRAAPPNAQIGYLAERLQIRHHSAVELVDRLVARGLAERRRDGSDRRAVQVLLTPEGEEILRRLSLHHRAELRSAGPALVRVLNALIDGRLTDAAERVLRDETALSR